MEFLSGQFGQPIADGLTSMPCKALLYESDIYFQDGWKSLVTAFGDSSAAKVVGNHALIILKPESFVGRRAHLAIEWLKEQAYSLVSWKEFVFSRFLSRALWAYQWNIADQDRKDACDLMVNGRVAIAILAAKPNLDTLQSASDIFSRQKGSSDPVLQKPNDLRNRLAISAKQMNFIHSADESADVVRELGVLFDEGERAEIIFGLQDHHDVSTAILDRCRELYSITPMHSLRLDDAFEGLRVAIERFGGDELKRASKLLERIACGQSRDWRALRALCSVAAINDNEWDMITLANHLCTYDIVGTQRLIPSIRDISSA